MSAIIVIKKATTVRTANSQIEKKRTISALSDNTRIRTT